MAVECPDDIYLKIFDLASWRDVPIFLLVNKQWNWNCQKMSQYQKYNKVNRQLIGLPPAIRNMFLSSIRYEKYRHVNTCLGGSIYKYDVFMITFRHLFNIGKLNIRLSLLSVSKSINVKLTNLIYPALCYLRDNTQNDRIMMFAAKYKSFFYGHQIVCVNIWKILSVCLTVNEKINYLRYLHKKRYIYKENIPAILVRIHRSNYDMTPPFNSMILSDSNTWHKNIYRQSRFIESIPIKNLNINQYWIPCETYCMLNYLHRISYPIDLHELFFRAYDLEATDVMISIINHCAVNNIQINIDITRNNNKQSRTNLLLFWCNVMMSIDFTHEIILQTNPNITDNVAGDYHNINIIIMCDILNNIQIYNVNTEIILMDIERYLWGTIKNNMMYRYHNVWELIAKMNLKMDKASILVDHWIRTICSENNDLNTFCLSINVMEQIYSPNTLFLLFHEILNKVSTEEYYDLYQCLLLFCQDKGIDISI